MMQAIFVTQVRADQDMAKLFKKARPFAINGPNVAKWARWLSQVSTNDKNAGKCQITATLNCHRCTNAHLPMRLCLLSTRLCQWALLPKFSWMLLLWLEMMMTSRCCLELSQEIGRDMQTPTDSPRLPRWRGWLMTLQRQRGETSIGSEVVFRV